jgi:hypothetical protein
MECRKLHVWRILLVGLTVLGFEGPASAAAVERVRFAIRIESLQSAEIDARFLLSAPLQARTEVSHLVIRLPGTTTEIIAAAGKEPIPFRVDSSGPGALRATLKLGESSGREYRVTYRVRDTNLRRLPLLVPFTAGGPDTIADCAISVEMSHGLALVGEPFPRLEFRDNRWIASLPYAPSLVFLPIARAGEAGILDRFLTVSWLTSGGLLLFLAAAVGYRLFLMRKLKKS